MQIIIMHGTNFCLDIKVYMFFILLYSLVVFAMLIWYGIKCHLIEDVVYAC